MEPNILVGDEFYVEPLAGPAPGTIVVLSIVRDGNGNAVPSSTQPDLERTFDLKRVIGVAGDTVALRGGRVLVDSIPIPVTETGRTFIDTNNRESSVLRETLGEREYEVLDSIKDIRDHPATVVPAGCVFVLGDNRDFSHDSRSYGVFPVTDLVGRVGEIFRSVNPRTNTERPNRVGTTPR